jgi:alanyl-tRNA synthetase
MPRPDKEVKKWFKAEASSSPEKYYATAVLKERGFARKHCACGTWFWTVNADQDHCGDSNCAGGFTLFKDNPAKKQMDYIQVWKEFSRMFEKKGYAIVPRYPVVARWNPTMDFTIASIAAFQPYVISGEVESPAKKLVIPQFCLRFGDVDNVGVTMSHMTGFVMIGQHAFLPRSEWDQNQFFKDIFDWLTDGLGLPYEEITFHEDAWAGGGNFGPCMEYFSRGVELGNQVYMMFEQDDSPEGYKELKLKVLDMGMGHERNAWFSQGKGTIYDATFPTVVSKLKQLTGVEYDEGLMQSYIPYAAYLNLDEVEDISEAWARVAKAAGIPAETLRTKVGPMTAIYSIAEHARSLLFALADGGLPSNVGGGYNLRVIFRRAQSFIEQYGWEEKVNMGAVARWHAEYLKPLFPELFENIADVERILEVELRKHRENKTRAGHVISNTLAKGSVTTEILISLYDAQGISPEQVRDEAKKQGMLVEVPDNFYSLVAERHEKSEQATQTRKEVKLPLDGVPKTTPLYYESYDYVDFEAPVVAVLDGVNVVLERSAFYPTSGGQEHDTGTIDGVKVVDVLKQDGIIVHVLAEKVDWKPGMMVKGKIDFARREQLAQHHTATHIINGAARRVLGNHVWQAGAAKTVEKGRIDITHYDNISDAELRKIEDEANRIVHLNLALKKDVEAKNLAEAEHGFRLYQGGAVPGKEIRVVEIPGFDVEACGGTHLNMTGETGTIRILRATKVQDGIVRIEFTAGLAAQKLAHAQRENLDSLMALLKVSDEKLLPAAAERVFNAWKAAKKAAKKNEAIDYHALENAKLEPYSGDVLAETAQRLQTQPQHVQSTLARFLKEITEFKHGHKTDEHRV